MEKLDTFFDPNDKPQKNLNGTFPMHIINVSVGKEVGGAIPYNLLLKVSEEAADFTGTDPDTGEEKSADFMVGKEIKSVGVWLNLAPKPGESWRNNKYIDLIEAAGIKLDEVDQGGKKRKQLVKITEMDILGRPVLGEVKPELDKRDVNKPKEEQRAYQKVHTFLNWEDGKPLDIAEFFDDPFAGVR